jgi:hypothetical protein
MDQLEELLGDTLRDAADSAPPPRGLSDGAAPRPHRRGILVIAGVAAAVAAIAIAVPAVINGQGDPQAPANTQPHPQPQPQPTTGKRTEPPGEAMNIYGDIYLSPDRRTLYAQVTESIVERGKPCWVFVDGTAHVDAAGVAEVRLTQHIVFRARPALPTGEGYICNQPSVGGPWYAQVRLSTPYHQPFVVDGRTGKHHRILGTLEPTPDQIVNWP